MFSAEGALVQTRTAWARRRLLVTRGPISAEGAIHCCVIVRDHSTASLEVMRYLTAQAIACAKNPNTHRVRPSRIFLNPNCCFAGILMEIHGNK